MKCSSKRKPISKSASIVDFSPSSYKQKQCFQLAEAHHGREQNKLTRSTDRGSHSPTTPGGHLCSSCVILTAGPSRHFCLCVAHQLFDGMEPQGRYQGPVVAST